MSGTNKNSHVSTKWEDTGGKSDIECDASALYTTNEDSLQELIDKELALRKTVAITNAIERPKFLLVDEPDATAQAKNKCPDEFDIFCSPVENRCQRSNSFALSRGLTITKVEDFDVLYNEVSSDEVFVNGHQDNLMLSPELGSVNSSKDIKLISKDVQEMVLADTKLAQNSNPSSDLLLVDIEPTNKRHLVSSSDETESSVDSVRVICNISTNNLDVDNNFDIDLTNSLSSASNDFVPISEVDIVSDSLDNELLSISTSTDEPSTISMSDMVQLPKINDKQPLDQLIEDGVCHFQTDPDEISLSENDLLCNASRCGTLESIENSYCHPCKADTVMDTLVLENNSNDYDHLFGSGISRTRNETFEKGFETWNIDVSTVSMVTAVERTEMTNSCEGQLNEECTYELITNDDVVSESNIAEKKTVKKKKSSSEGTVTTSKFKKTKKTKKYEEKENISVKTGLGKFDQLSKKAVMHVRSADSAKVQQQFTQSDVSQDSGNLCKACNKNVFAMEQIKAERHVWHKNCFRCKTCNKQLTVDVYSSHEGELFCKPHFRDLFKPKTVVEEEKPLKFKKPELIIRENKPMELPPDVVRASDKPDLGLEELSSLNVKSRFQVFEKPQVEGTTDKSSISVKRSPSILSKLAKFQAKGMDVGVSSDIFNGIDYEESSSSEEEAAVDDSITRSIVVKEKPIAFNKMNDVKMNWENGQAAKNEERREQRREEMQSIRSRLFMGKQNKMKEAYENAVAESERLNVKKDVEVKSDKARSIKEKFEKGESLHKQESEEEYDKKSASKQEDLEVFEAGISKKSRSIFQQMDAAIKTQTQNQITSPPPSIMQNGNRSRREVISRQVSNDVVRATDPVEEIAVETADISSKFKFFETYKAPEVKRKAFRITPPREGQLLKSESPERETTKNPNVVRCDEQAHDENEVLKKSHTTAKMLSLFRQLEEAQDSVPDGPKPLKKFTPPPHSNSASDDESEEESSEEQSEASNSVDDIVRASDKTEDEYLKLAQKATKAKMLKEKFEKWEPEKNLNNSAINLLESEQANLDTTKSLRARFESIKAEQPTEKSRPRVHRFVDKSLPGYCDTCFKKVYPLEKVEAGDKVFHRNCFKCFRCNGILRMETFTMNNGHLYCVPHFKQLFISKGNYDEGFGNHQHKSKWPMHTGLPVTNGIH